MEENSDHFSLDRDENEFLNTCITKFDDCHVDLSLDELKICETVGELEHFLHTKIQHSFESRMRPNVQAKTLAHINSCMEKYVTRPITLEDMDSSILDLAHEIEKHGWSVMYTMLCASLINLVPKPRYTPLAKGLILLLVFVDLLLFLFIGINAGWLVGTAVAVVVSGIMGMFILYFPKYVPDPEATMRDAIDRYIDRIEKYHQVISLVEVQHRLRPIFASWAGIDDANSIENQTVIRQ